MSFWLEHSIWNAYNFYLDLLYFLRSKLFFPIALAWCQMDLKRCLFIFSSSEKNSKGLINKVLVTAIRRVLTEVANRTVKRKINIPTCTNFVLLGVWFLWSLGCHLLQYQKVWKVWHKLMLSRIQNMELMV